MSKILTPLRVCTEVAERVCVDVYVRAAICGYDERGRCSAHA
jgi:hypothetical protein